MSHSFYRISQSLRVDHGRSAGVLLAIAAALAAGWLAWAFKAQVTRYEVSDSARLEMDGAAYPVETSVAGRLLSSHLDLGRQVRAGEILAELESKDQQLSLHEEQVHRASLQPQLAALQSQMKLEDLGRTDERQVLNLSVEGAEAQYRQADAQATLAETEARRAVQLRADGLISQADAQRIQADAQSKRAAAESVKTGISRLTPELQVRERAREVRLKQVAADLAKLQADAETSSANIQRLEYEIERRGVRAPIDGVLSECAALRVGEHVVEGQQLGVVVPRGRVQVIAEFAPAAALGKVRPGQKAAVRLEGFPWAQFGTLPATVERVAGDIRGGKIRVELAVAPGVHSRIPIQHGLPGSVEIEIERASPAILLLRSVGQSLGAH